MSSTPFCAAASASLFQLSSRCSASSLALASFSACFRWHSSNNSASISRNILRTFMLSMMRAPDLNSQMQMWYHPQGNSLSVSTWYFHLGKLGTKCQGHPVVHKQLPPPRWSAWVSREFQTEWHAPKYKYFFSWKTTSTYWQSLYYFHAIWSMKHEHHQCTDHG